MAEKIKLKAKSCVQAFPKEMEFTLPDKYYFAGCEAKPSLLVECLELCNGDMRLLCQQFSTRAGASQEAIAMRIMRVLNKPENEPEKSRFYELIQAHKDAKYLLAQHQAFDFIADFTPPKKTSRAAGDMSLSQVTTYMRFWLAGPMASEVAKSKGKSAEAASDDGLGDVLKGLEKRK